MNRQKIALFPKVHGLGGMVSFRTKFREGLINEGFEPVDDPLEEGVVVCLVIGGTRKIDTLWRAKKQGVCIVQRLNGMNWLHRLVAVPFKKKVRAAINNQILAFIRRSVADRIIYQSEFSQWWWNERYGRTALPSSVIYNGIALDHYQPLPAYSRPEDKITILMLEGHLGDFYSNGLSTAYRLAQQLAHITSRSVEIQIAGNVSLSVKEKFPDTDMYSFNLLGVLTPEDIPAIANRAHMLFSSDLNAACPNAVVEALACGLPVLSYDTGALKEMVPDIAGAVVPYGSNYWKLEPPDIEALAAQARVIWQENTRYRAGARETAVKKYSLETMTRLYLAALLS